MKTSRTVRCIGLTAASLALLAGAGSAMGQCTMNKFLHADRLSDDQLGTSVAMFDAASGVHVVAGAPGDDHDGLNSAGSVRFYYRNVSAQWGEADWLTITASDATANARFGHSVAAGSPNIVVGAPAAGTWGKVYVYHQFGPQFVEHILPYSGGVNGSDSFGEAVAIDGNWIVAGAPDYDSVVPGLTITDIGRTAFYKWDSNADVWTLQTLHAIPNTGVQFQSEGSAVAISGDRAASGAYLYGAPGEPSQHGGVYIFDRSGNNWSARPVLWPADIEAAAWFGASVAMDGSYLVVGAPKADLQPGIDPVTQYQADAGSVYIYRFDANNAAVLEAKITAADAAAGDLFGTSVSLKNGLLVVSSSNAEKAYVFRRVAAGKWSQFATMSDPDGPNSFAYGTTQTVATQGQYVAIGDKYDNAGGVIAGAVYVIEPTAAYGDTCDAAVPVQIGNYGGCTTFAAKGPGATCGNSGANGQGPDVWYSWTPACSGNIILDTFGSGFDTVLSVHSDCPDANNTNTIACNDDGFPSPNRASLVTLNYAAGTTYLIRIAGYNNASGTFTLRMVDSSNVPNDSCSSPTAVSSGNAYTFATCKATTDANITAGCVAQSTNDVWFRFTAPTAAGTLNLDTAGSSFDTVLSVYTGGACPTNTASIACNDDASFNTLTSALTTNLQSGQQYLIRVAGYATTRPVGDGVLHVNFVPTCHCDWNLSGQLSVQDIFDFLASYFAGQGDFNASGQTTVQDIFDFLACYFAGCV